VVCTCVGSAGDSRRRHRHVPIPAAAAAYDEYDDDDDDDDDMSGCPSSKRPTCRRDSADTRAIVTPAGLRISATPRARLLVLSFLHSDDRFLIFVICVHCISWALVKSVLYKLN